jgi:hypothetical protein
MARRVPERAAARRADEAPLDPRVVEIWAWRVEQLERAGYSRPVAHRLADNGEVDLHVACDLLARGCPEPTAFAILS